ncbi:MAG: aminotransferase class V-fold PLP-dependent enzyme, partial [Sphingomicrobium sp.]
CAQPLMAVLGVEATCRASFAAHSEASDIAALVSGLHQVKRIFG